MTATASRQPSVAAGAVRRRMVNAWPVWLLTLATFAIYTLFALERHRQFNTAGFDLGIFDQAVRRYAHFQAPIVPLKGMSYNIWGDHFHPIIATAAPLYWIWGHPETLLILQAALIASSVPVIYRFARRGRHWSSASRTPRVGPSKLSLTSKSTRSPGAFPSSPWPSMRSTAPTTRSY
jgi:hypothetical protein